MCVCVCVCVLRIDWSIHDFPCGEGFQRRPRDYRGRVVASRFVSDKVAFTVLASLCFISVALNSHTHTHTHTHTYTSLRFGALDPGRQVALFRITVCRLGELGEVGGGGL